MDPILAALITQLLRSGPLTVIDINEIATRLEREGLPDAAYAVRVCVIEASAPSPDEQSRDARAGFVIHDGGNSAG